MKNRITLRNIVRFNAFIFLISFVLTTPIALAEDEAESEFSVVSFAHRDKNGGIADFLITFSKPVIGLDKLYTELPENALQVTPSIESKARWIGYNRIGIYLDSPLSPSVKYTFELYEQLETSTEYTLMGDRQFTYSTKPFKVDRAEIKFQYDKTLQKAKAVGVVYFNYSVTVKGLEDYLSIITGRGETVPYIFQEQSPIAKTVIIEIHDILPILEGGFLQVKVGKGFKCTGTEIGLDEATLAAIDLGGVKALQVNQSGFGERVGTQFIRLSFNSPITLDMLRKHVTVTPSIPFQLVGNRNDFEIHGEFKVGEQYSVKISIGIASTEGYILRDTFVATLKVPNLPQRISFTDNTFFIPRKGPMKLNVATTNIDEIEYAIAKYHLSSLPTLIHKGNIKVASDINEEMITSLELKKYLKEEHAGILKVMVHADKGKTAYAEQLIVVTDLGIVTKRIDEQLWVWVNSLDSIEPISKADVQLIDKNNMDVLLSGKTDNKGFVKFDFPPDLLKNNPQFLITVNKGIDFSLMQLQRQAISTSGLDIGGIPYLVDGYEAYLYTDRGVYRPGETANLVGIVRGKNNETPTQLPIQIDIITPLGTTQTEIQKQTDNEGACEVQIPISDSALTGWYSAKMISGKKEIGTIWFQVEEFIPDRMKVSLEVEKDSYMITDEIAFEVMASNLYGTAAGGRKVTPTCLIESSLYVPPEKWRSFNFSDIRHSFNNQWVDLENTVTDIHGISTYKFNLPKDIKPPSALNCAIQATVQELGGRAVSASKRILVHPYSHYIGINRPEEGTVKRNEKVEFNYIVLNKDGKIEERRPVKVTFSKVDDSHVWRGENTPTYTELETRTLTSTNEPGTIGFSPVALGIHLVEIEDVNSGMKTAMRFYVSEWGGVPWSIDNADRLEMTLDKSSYRPGEKAKLTIKPPFPGKILLTIEREKVLSFHTYIVNENSLTLTIPVQKTYSPNVYLSVILIRSTTSLDSNTQARAFGIVPLIFDAELHQLNVEIDAPEQIRPNSNVDIKLRVRGKRKEQPYRITIAAVDEGILQLTGTETPTPHTFFYQQRLLKTASYEFHNSITKDTQFPIKPIESLADMLNLVISYPPKAKRLRQPIVAKSLARGQIAFDQSSAVVVAFSNETSVVKGNTRRINTDSVFRVIPNALWSGLLTTDINGIGNIRFKVPQFNGTLRIMAVAFSGSDYGSATDQIQVRDPVVMTPTFPRFLSSGDQFRVPISVYNGTPNTGDFKVKLQATGPVKLLTGDGPIHHIEIIDSDSLEKEIKVEADTEGQLYFDVIAHDAVGIATFNLSVIGGDEVIQSAPIRIPIRSASPPVTKSGHGIVRQDEPAEFILPSNLRADTSEFMITVSPLPTLRFANSLRDLVRYPHGCLEQTTSRVFPLLYLSDLAKIVEPPLAEDGKIEEFINAGIKKIENMLTPDLHFSYWQGRAAINKWSSVYAAHFLVEARIAGYKISDYNYNRMLEGLRRQTRLEWNVNNSNEKSDRYSLAQTVYACYVLSKAGHPEKQVMFHLRNNRLNDLSEYSQFQLAGAFAHSGDVKIALSMLPETVKLDKTNIRETGRNFDSDIRTEAIILDMLLEIKENHPSIPKLVESLTNSASKSRGWTTTQEKAFAFLALGKFLNKQPQQKFSGTITRDGDNLVHFDSIGKSVTGSDWDGLQFKVNIQGNGTCYYYWEAFGVGRDSYIEEYGHELQVNRRYLTADRSRFKNVFKQGELLIAEITVKALTHDLENVVVVDMLPAGFEIENPRLKSSQGDSILYQQEFTPNYIDIRDDRLVFYASFPMQHEQKFYYTLRAVTEGRFTLPPVSAEAMYDPSKSAVAATGTIQVVK